MKRSLILLTTMLLAGCVTIPALEGQLQNRVTTTLACDRGFFTSLYGRFGFTSEIDQRDLAEMPCAARDKAALPAPVAPLLK
jgi:hypothetical protein